MGFDYNRHLRLKHHICFKCRIGIKTKNRKQICPHCSNVMEWVGPTVRIPKKSDIKGWNKMYKTYTDGNDFWNKWWC